MPDTIYKVRISDIFEGPLDLLIHLIRKAEVDVYDIPIGRITDQYLEYLEWIQTMNIDLAGDFLVMAATLTQIKSKMLLPVQADDGEDDPRMEIVRPLTEYLKIKHAAEKLAGRDLLGKDIFVRSTDVSKYRAPDGEEMIQVGLFELIEAFQRILDRMAPDHRVELAADRISVRDRISQLVELFEKGGSLAFDELFAGCPDKADIVVTFLAMLEMVKLNLLRISQHRQTGIIRLIYI